MQAPQAVALFRDIEAGRHIKQHSGQNFSLIGYVLGRILRLNVAYFAILTHTLHMRNDVIYSLSQYSQWGQIAVASTLHNQPSTP
ncbi:MAG: hypothetical protein M1840_003416 [Geoglossum simile]|nr:MAG: hypothetical protein M1840_003416 [Geoglossum simile]